MSWVLRLEGLSKRFGGLQAVQDLGFSVAEGEVLGLLGPNGSGKTTALNLITGGLAADTGVVELRGRSIAGLPAHRIARAGVARTFQLVRVMPTMSAAQNVAVGLMFSAQPMTPRMALRSAEPLLARVGLGGRGEVAAGNLTYIDQKRLELARALASSPCLLLLDEWLAGLNPSELLEGIDLIRTLSAQGVSIVMVEHVLSAIRSLCGRCVVMSSGRKIAEGATEKVLVQPEVVRAYIGDDDA